MATPRKPSVKKRRGTVPPADCLASVIGGRSNQVGLQVRRLRMRQDLTQQGLEARVALLGYAMGQSRIAKIEAGTRSVWDYEVPLLAKALKVSISELYGA